MSAGELFDVEAIVARTLEPTRARLADALVCVLDMPEDLATSAAQNDAQWDERAGWLSWTDPARGPLRYRLDRGHFEPASAWEAVVSHGLVPESWFDDSTRRFLTRSLDRAMIDRSMAPRRLPHPHTLRSCVLAAADAPSMIAAERLCVEALTALAPWSRAEVQPQFLWQFDNAALFARSTDIGFVLRGSDSPLPEETEVDPWSLGYGVRACAALNRAATVLRRVGGSVKAFPSRRPGEDWRASFERLAYSIAIDANRWAAAAANEARVQNATTLGSFLEPVENVAFSSLPNPFAPLAEVFSLGFVVAALTPLVHLVVCED